MKIIQPGSNRLVDISKAPQQQRNQEENLLNDKKLEQPQPTMNKQTQNNLQQTQQNNEERKPTFQWEGQKKILLLGNGGVGKRLLFRQLSIKTEQIMDFQEYEFSEGNQNYCITKSVDFDLDDNIDERENKSSNSKIISIKILIFILF